MSPQIIYSVLLAAFVLCVAYLDLKHHLLRDSSSARRKPYSLSRIQLAWWTSIVLASLGAVMMTRGVPLLDASTLVLLGISSATTASARIADVSDQARRLARSQDGESEGLILDILSDSNGVSVHRFQNVALNVLFGAWFVVKVWTALPDELLNDILPVIDTNSLVLLGISSGTYAALKTKENASPADAQSEIVQDEALGGTRGEG